MVPGLRKGSLVFVLPLPLSLCLFALGAQDALSPTSLCLEYLSYSSSLSSHGTCSPHCFHLVGSPCFSWSLQNHPAPLRTCTSISNPWMGPPVWYPCLFAEVTEHYHQANYPPLSFQMQEPPLTWWRRDWGPHTFLGSRQPQEEECFCHLCRKAENRVSGAAELKWKEPKLASCHLCAFPLFSCLENGHAHI